MTIRKYKLITGEKFSIFSLEKNGKKPISDFLLELEKRDDNSYKTLLRKLKLIADRGIPYNEEIFKIIKGYDNLYEIKSKQIRIFCFFYGEKIIITTNYFKKQSNKTPQHEIKKAESIKQEYLNNKKGEE